ncbi:MAG: hypothetical protein JST93_07970 [Acidobacteria bacterium]|nr:hypothetical protein [Acidobacteriota bacterium]
MFTALLDALRGTGTLVGFAGDAPVSIPASLLRTMLEGQFRDMRIELSQGEERSSIAFPSALGLPKLNFRTDAERMSLRSRQVFASLREGEPGWPNGAIELEIWLEPVAGVGKPVTLTVRLGLSTEAHGAVYDRVQVHCECSHGGGDPLLATCVEAFFYWVYTREAVAGVLRAAISQALGDNVGILDVAVEGSNLAIWRYRL